MTASWSSPEPPSNSSTPPTDMLTGPCSAASEERSAGESSSAIGFAATLLVPPQMGLQQRTPRLHALLVLGRAGAQAVLAEDPQLPDDLRVLLVGARDPADDAVRALLVERM